MLYNEIEIVFNALKRDTNIFLLRIQNLFLASVFYRVFFRVLWFYLRVNSFSNSDI